MKPQSQKTVSQEEAVQDKPSWLPTVNYLSETVFGLGGNGVHTAFLNTLAMMKPSKEFHVRANSPIPASILHAHTFGPLYWLMKWTQGAKTVVHAHAIPETLVGQVKGSDLWLPLFRRYLVAYFNSAELVICMTQTLKAQLIAMGVRRPIEVVTLPINLSQFSQDKDLRKRGRARLGLKAEDEVVLGVGQMIPRKGIFDFVEVARRNPALQFVWAGEIPFSVASDSYTQVKELVQTKPNNLRFAGPFGLADMPEIYNAADLFLFPSYQETFGLAIAEAAACGLPLVLRDLETYKESFGGHYLHADHADGFSRQVRRAFANPSLMRKLGSRAQRAVGIYDHRRAAARLENLYLELCQCGESQAISAGAMP
jgi:1,2-diacylglycerol-3-alpha-glucose alpha-1,2-galactosyltransferase